MMDPKMTGHSTSNSTSGYGSQIELMAQRHKVPTEFLTHSRGSVDSFTDYTAQFALPPPSTKSRLTRERSRSKRNRQRLVYKNGEVNVVQTNIKKRKQRYLADIFTTLVDLKWRWILLLFILAFTLSWLSFALIWWLICFSHGDINNYGDSGHKPCVKEVHNFVTALLFSIETQHTIGYGSRHTTDNCAEAIFVMMLQSCFGVIIQALMTGIVFAKLSRPKYRAETLLFSKNAVVCTRDGQLVLLCRVGDMRKSHLVEAHVKAVLIKQRHTKEGERIALYEHEVQIGPEEGCDYRLFLLWPTILEHKIDEGSPFWDIGPEDLHKAHFELIVILEGIVESTGMTTQARTSYLPGEILWGHRLERMEKRKDNGELQVNYSKFNSTIPVDIPQCSAKELAELSESNSANVSYDEEVEEEEEEDDDDDDLSISTESSANLKGHALLTDSLAPPNHVIPMMSHGFKGEAEFMDEDAFNYANQL